MERIKVSKIQRVSPSIILSTVFIIDIPESLKNIKNKESIAKSYDVKYGIESIDDKEYFSFTTLFEFNNQVSLEEIKQTLEENYNGVKQKLSQFELNGYDEILNVSFDGENWV